MNRKERRAAEKKKKAAQGTYQPVQPGMSAQEIEQQKIIQKAFQTATELQKIDKFAEARSLYEDILNVEPNHPGALHHLALIEHGNGEMHKAEKLLQKALKAMPNYHQAWNSLGTVLRKMRRHEDALRAFEKAIELKPDYADAITNRGNVMWDLGEYAKAEELYREALEADRTSDLVYVTHMSLGHALRDQGRLDEARESYNTALELNPDNAELLLAMGEMERSCGDFEEAENFIRRAIEQEPDYVEAHRALSGIKKFTDENDPDLQALRGLDQLAKTEPHTRTWLGNLNFALAKAYEDLEDYDLAFEKYAYANKLIRENYEYDPKRIERYFDTIVKCTTREFMDEHAGEGVDSDKPIFIVGMPRSGTSLVEQILASHSDVHGAGELKSLPKSVIRVRGLPPEHTDELFTRSFANKLNEERLHEIAQSYLEDLERFAPGAKRVTDKMPTNFVWVWLIKLAFPNAKIIHCVRDPVATCLSCFTRFFSELTSWSHDMEEIAWFYKNYRKMMDHWDDVMPGEILHMRYEDLVTDQEAQTRRLLDHCGLDWQDDCLNFHKTKRRVSTASDTQVRKPIYTSSIDAWKRYEKHLQPMIDALGDYAETH